MSRKDLLDHLNERLRAAEKELASFKAAIANHGMHVFERDINGERDVTDRHLKEVQDVCEEYRRLIRMWSAE